MLCSAPRRLDVRLRCGHDAPQGRQAMVGDSRLSPSLAVTGRSRAGLRCGQTDAIGTADFEHPSETHVVCAPMSSLKV